MRIYPIEPWNVTETAHSEADNYRAETVFALSNGYIGTRGTFEEGYARAPGMGMEGNYVNGFYESEEIRYGERNYGFPEHSQSMVNLPNLKTTRVYLDGEPFDMRRGTVSEYRRTLNMREGILTRSLIWDSPAGARARIETARFASFAAEHILAQRITVTPLNFEGEIRLVSEMDADTQNHTEETNPLIDYGPFGRTLIAKRILAHDDMLLYAGRTKNSKLGIACGCAHTAHGVRKPTKYTMRGLGCAAEYTARGKVTLDKFIAYITSLDTADDLLDAVTAELRDAERMGFELLAARQRAYMKRYWEHADIVIDGDNEAQQGLRFNMFHAMQGAGRNGRTGMGAKGLTGEGYVGHYFWDTEIYALPVFIYTYPALARALLDYRYGTLDTARERARELGHSRGALFPWRTINGRECSAYFPLGTAAYHINADVAYAFAKYADASGDFGYLKEKAAEVLCETARVWADVGCFAEGRDGKYCICSVTGPDEYTALKDNNFYTNLMARENLRDAARAVRRLQAEDPAAYKALSEKIALEPDEARVWEETAEKMYLPYDQGGNVYLQDDGYLLRKPWHPAAAASDATRLLYEKRHPLFVWRQRMAKQADTILALLLRHEYFDNETVARHYDYYRKSTLHHSSLSVCVFGVAACAAGRMEEACGYFARSVRMDIDDTHGDMHAGIHAANMAGSWLMVAHGFAGLRTGGGAVTLQPMLPPHWNSYSFRFSYGGAEIEVTTDKNGCNVRHLAGAPVRVALYGNSFTLQEKGDAQICAGMT
ncbi:MAG: glycoside hydrolase family 65 protein [Oscillospiraceae bacterium]|jgi:alpha,alpha-trehalose phosphorylase|nr:glycoside hydrolase family 65 protein [Oscillospiraceae bacterium]